MTAATSFELGTEQLLEPKHIGQVILVDHFRPTGYKKGDDPFWECVTTVGTLAGFREDRGQDAFVSYEPPEDIGSFPDYTVTIIFEHGESIRVTAQDKASITLYPKESAS